MSPFIIVVIEPELELILNVFKIIVRFDIPPVEFPLHCLVESFDLSVVFRSVWRIHDEFDSIGCKAFSKCFCIKSIVRSDGFDSSRKLPDESADEVDSVRNRIPFIYPSDDESRTIVDCIDRNNISSLSERKARIELDLRSWLVVGVELRIILPSLVFSAIPDLVSFENSPDRCGMQGYSVVILEFL